jgi:hypothetical protein
MSLFRSEVQPALLKKVLSLANSLIPSFSSPLLNEFVSTFLSISFHFPSFNDQLFEKFFQIFSFPEARNEISP